MRAARAHVAVAAAVAMMALAMVIPGSAEVPMTFANRETGFGGGEPTLGVLPNGSIALQARHRTMMTDDEGLTWRQAHVPVSQAVSLDPYVHVDEKTGRILASQLLGACQMLSISDDAGVTWVDAPSQCGTVDHQKLGSGPWHKPAPAAATYARAVYTCTNQVAGGTACSTSLDGGLTWLPEVMAFPPIDPGADEGIYAAGGCFGLSGDPVSGPDGTIYLPREYCGRPFLGRSVDNGLTWTIHQVSTLTRARPIAYGANNPSVTAGPDGSLYYAWTGSDWRHYLARSADAGATWTDLGAVSPPDVLSTTFPHVIEGRPGAVATAYIGTRGSDKGPDLAAPSSRWHLFVTYAFDANGPSPTWTTVQVTPETDPVMIGCVARHGSSCGGSPNLLDFNDIALTVDGRIAISYTDGCIAPICTNQASSTGDRSVLAIQTAGPVLR